MSETNSSADQNPTGKAIPTLTVDLWADFVCPWCYLGERRFFLALSQFEHASHVAVRRHPFELDANAESCGSERMVDIIEKKYDIDADRAHALEARLAQLCSEVGLEYTIDRIPANTLDAHRLIALAQEHIGNKRGESARRGAGRNGSQGGESERGDSDHANWQCEEVAAPVDHLYHAHFVDQACLGDRDTLRSLAGEVGLPSNQVDELFAGDRFTNEVRMDAHRALELGAEGVPFFVFDDRLALAGAQASEVFLEALNKAWHEMSPDQGQ